MKIFERRESDADGTRIIYEYYYNRARKTVHVVKTSFGLHIKTEVFSKRTLTEQQASELDDAIIQGETCEAIAKGGATWALADCANTSYRIAIAD